MYTRCINCYADLGRNDTVEHLPVGRRLAFDGARGRLWVVCRSCRRWNLTPLEERWEAIETCERLYRATPQRRGTGQVGLARLSSRLDLIRGSTSAAHRPTSSTRPSAVCTRIRPRKGSSTGCS